MTRREQTLEWRERVASALGRDLTPAESKQVTAAWVQYKQEPGRYPGPFPGDFAVRFEKAT